MAKRVYENTVKKWLKRLAIPIGTLIGGIFLYLSMLGAITITGYSADVICDGTLNDPCYAYINFTANEDIFIYPTDYDPWGRNVTFEFDPAIREWKLQRSWGSSWRNIPLDKICTGTWCGLSDSKDKRKFSIAFREGRNYQIRIVAYKNHPRDTVKWSAFNKSIDPFWYGKPVGYEYQNDSTILHFWNENDDYYLNVSSGIQITNHPNEFWTHNIFCAGIKYPDWNYYCTDALRFTWSIDTDNSTYFNYTGYRDVTKIVQGTKYKVRFVIRYNLLSNYTYLNLQLYVKNIGSYDIPVDIGFAWRIKDIQIGNDTVDDWLYINNSKYWLNETKDSINFTSLPKTEAFFHDSKQGKWLWLNWSENLNYKYWLQNMSGQYNAVNTLLINAGTLNVNQEKHTTFGWVDALCSWNCNHLAPSGQQDIYVGDTFNHQASVTYSGDCSVAGSIQAEYNDSSTSTGDEGTDFIKIDSSGTNLTTTSTNPQSWYLCRFGNCGTRTFVVTGEEDNQDEGMYGTSSYCTFNGGETKATGGSNINISAKPPSKCDGIIVLTESMTLTADNASCFVLNADDIVFNCNGYEMIGDYYTDGVAINTSDRDNISIRNCMITNHTAAIEINHSTNVVMDLLKIFNTTNISSGDMLGHAIKVTDSENVSLYNSLIENTSMMSSSSGSCDHGSLMAMRLDNVTNMTFWNDTFWNTSGFYYYDSSEDTGCQPAQLFVGTAIGDNGDNCNNMTIFNSTFDKTKSYTIDIDGDNANISHINVLQSGSFGNRVTGNNTVFHNNNISSRIRIYGHNAKISDCSFHGREKGFYEAEDNTFYAIDIDTGYENTSINHISVKTSRAIKNRGKNTVVSNLISEDAIATDTDDGAILEYAADPHGNYTNITLINTTFTDNLMNSRRASFFISITNNINISDITIKDTDVGIGFLISDNSIVTNITFDNIALNHTYSATSSNNNSLYNPIDLNTSRMEVAAGNDMHVFYYLDAHVQETDYDPIATANVNVTNSTTDNNPEIVTTTDANGVTGIFFLKGFNNTGGTVYNFTEHNVTANKTGYVQNSSNVSLTENVTIVILMESMVADTCTCVDGQEWKIEHNCTLITSCNTCPYGTNITKTGSLNISGDGFLNTSNLWMYDSGMWFALILNSTKSLEINTNC